jgi:G6PDH family F420-dependent oxidoreductase
MIKFGYKLMSEEHGPTDLVRNANRAEQAGFDFAAISDHFFPWVEEQGHSPFAWSVLGALANATQQIGLMTAVTCPIMRYHPAIIAQSAATVALLSDNRFTLGLGAGGTPERTHRGRRLARQRRASRTAFGSARNHPGSSGRHFDELPGRLFRAG